MILKNNDGYYKTKTYFKNYEIFQINQIIFYIIIKL